MTGPQLIAVIIGGLLLLALISLLTMYNRFVRQRNLVQESWHQIDVELTRRHDLIPNLVETVKAYAAHERAVLDALVSAREAATTHASAPPQERGAFEGKLSGALSSTLVRAEAYPDLKANQNFLALQDELTNTEDRIAAARRFYNGNVRALNTRVGTFPSNLVASMFGFSRAEFFDLPDRVPAGAPDVQL